MFTIQKHNHNEKPEKEAIHSGHFMVSHFEAEAQDDEDELAVPVPEEVIEIKNELLEVVPIFKPATMTKREIQRRSINQQQLGIDTSLSKLFQCMSLAYRQKLTSPKWNRFRGIRLRWKDKIRLNNVIWRCWHMQFIKKENTLICQFASPLDVDTHNKPEAVVLEGKYWKRKLAAVTAEYKKWRMFYRNQAMGHTKDTTDMLSEMELLAWNSQNPDDSMHMMVDEDYMGLMSDTLFSTITNTPFAFPDTREIAKAGLADFIQPSLGPLQPNLDDYMDTFEPFHDLISGKLAPVPEENVADHIYKTVNWCYSELDLMTGAAVSNAQLQEISSNSIINTNYNTEPGQMQPIILAIKQNNMSNSTQQLGTYTALNPYTNTSRESMYTPSTPIATKNINLPSKSITDLTPIKINPIYGKNYNSYRQQEAIPQVQQQQRVQETQELDLYKLNDVRNTNVSQPSHGYKFTAPAKANVKFSPSSYKQLTPENNNLKVEKTPTNTSRIGKSGGVRGRQRSRSNTREQKRPPPLLSAISDPSLINSSNSALLTQLLTNSESSNLFGTNARIGGSSHELHSVRIKEEHTPVPILPQPSPVPATLIITTPLNVTQLHSPMNEPLILSTARTSSSPAQDSNSSHCLNSPTSSQGSLGSPTRDRRSPSRDQRRVGHIHAEQKRRYNIKNGFDMIHSLIPHLSQNPNTKLSKAAMLQKGAEYIKQLRTERNLLKEEMDSLKQQIETLNTSISNCQSLLPATGAPVSRRRDNKIQEMFDDYVRNRTLEDWKFWIFSLLFRPLLASFNNFVSTSSVDDLYRSTLLWIEQHCTLVDLRPVVLNSLRYLCTKTDILSEPEKLPEEARQVVLANDNSTS